MIADDNEEEELLNALNINLKMGEKKTPNQRSVPNQCNNKVTKTKLQ